MSRELNILVGGEGRLRAGWRFAVAVLMVLLANMVAAVVASSASNSTRSFDAIFRPVLMVLLVAVFAGLLRVLDEVEDKLLPAMGLPLRAKVIPPSASRLRLQGSPVRDVLGGALLGSGMVVVAVVVIAAGGELAISLKVTPHTLKLAGVEVVILATGAMAEELMFRGYPFQRLVDAIGATGAVVLASALFGVVHLQNPHASAWGVVNTAAVGALLALAYLRTRSLWMPWGIHVAWNTTLGLIFGLPVSGLTEFAVVVRTQAIGPEWLTGGKYGLEASATGAMVIAAGLGLLVWFVRPEQRAAAVWKIAAEQRADG